jgi:hypothetical protein
MLQAYEDKPPDFVERISDQWQAAIEEFVAANPKDDREDFQVFAAPVKGEETFPAISSNHPR